MMTALEGDISTGVAAASIALVATLLAGDAGAETVTLDEVLQEVPERHETRQITEMDIRQSQAMRRQALAALLPQLNANADLTRQGGEEVELGDQAIRQRYDWGVNVTTSLTLFDGPAYFDYWEADALLDVTESSAQWERHLLELNAEQSFYALASAQREVEIAEAAIEWRRDYLEEAQARRDAGMAIEVDVSRARAEVLEAEQALLEAEAALGNAADALATLMGRSPESTLRADVEPDTLETDPPEQRTEITDERADFDARRSSVEAAELGRRGIWWSLAPELSINVNTRWGETSAFEPDYFNWSASLSASWTLYDGGARYARADAAQAEVRQQELELDRELRDANHELVEALRDWRSASAAVDVAEEQREVAESTYDQILARFEQGLVSSLEVSDASQELLSAELGFNQVRLQARLAEVQYRYLESELE